MGIAPVKQPQTPGRALSEYTVGEPDKRVDLSSAASSPNLAGSTSLSVRPFLIAGFDYKTTTSAIGAQVDGATVTTTVTITFPNLPNPFTPGVTDNVKLLVRPDITTNIAGMAIGGWSVTPQSFSNGVTYSGMTPQGGITYTSFSASITVILVAAGATGSGTLTVGASALLLDLPG